eukprot:2154692-Pyramimonas_sp.AAC.1
MQHARSPFLSLTVVHIMLPIYTETVNQPEVQYPAPPGTKTLLITMWQCGICNASNDTPLGTQCGSCLVAVSVREEADAHAAAKRAKDDARASLAAVKEASEACQAIKDNVLS